MLVSKVVGGEQHPVSNDEITLTHGMSFTQQPSSSVTYRSDSGVKVLQSLCYCYAARSEHGLEGQMSDSPCLLLRNQVRVALRAKCLAIPVVAA